jgi:hypothetical protein
MFALPEEGADVWIEFEGGHPNKPIWSGGFWEEGLEPLMPELAPEMPELVNVFKSKLCTLVMNDTPELGGITLKTMPPATTLPVTLEMNSLGVKLTVGELSLSMNPESGITLTAAEASMNLSPAGQTTEAPTIEMTAEAEVNVTGAEVSVEGNTSVTGAFEVEGATTLTAEATVGGELSVAGAAEMLGELGVTGALTAEGAANFVGVVAVEGEANFAGAVSIEGDLNVLGGQQTEGNNATAGMIEGVLVPPF